MGQSVIDHSIRQMALQNMFVVDPGAVSGAWFGYLRRFTPGDLHTHIYMQI